MAAALASSIAPGKSAVPSFRCFSRTAMKAPVFPRPFACSPFLSLEMASSKPSVAAFWVAPESLEPMSQSSRTIGPPIAPPIKPPPTQAA